MNPSARVAARSALVLTAVAAATIALTARGAQPVGAILIRHATLIDGSGAAPRKADVVFRKGASTGTYPGRVLRRQ